MSKTILAIDTATEQCSVALIASAHSFERVVPTARGHAEMILPLIDEVLSESGLKLTDVDGLAFGRGPGSFTGVRVAVGVIQGLAFAKRLPVIGISNLAAVAQQAASTRALAVGERILVCMDARMRETYWAVYAVLPSGLVALIDDEHVSPPHDVRGADIRFGAGTAWSAYPSLAENFRHLVFDGAMLPRAREIAVLAVHELNSGRGVTAAEAQPTYLRDEVATPRA